jgi:hypothetical protein
MSCRQPLIGIRRALLTTLAALLFPFAWNTNSHSAEPDRPGLHASESVPTACGKTFARSIGSGFGLGPDCPPCGPLYCLDPAAADAARAAKKAKLRADGYPERLLNLLDQYKCVACIRFAPDTFSIMIEYQPGTGPPNGQGGSLTHEPFQWTPQQEALARKELRQGTIKSFYIYNSSSTCRCCGEKDPHERSDWNSALQINTSGTLAFTNPSDLGPDPPEVKAVPPEWLRELPPLGTYTKPQAHVMCPACKKYADQLDDLWSQKLAAQRAIDVGNRAIAERQNQISTLEYQQLMNPLPGVDLQIENLNHLNSQQAENDAKFSAQIDHFFGLIAETQTELLACEQTSCKTPTSAQQLPSGPVAPAPNPAKQVETASPKSASEAPPTAAHPTANTGEPAAGMPGAVPLPPNSSEFSRDDFRNAAMTSGLGKPPDRMEVSPYTIGFGGTSSDWIELPDDAECPQCSAAKKEAIRLSAGIGQGTALQEGVNDMNADVAARAYFKCLEELCPKHAGRLTTFLGKHATYVFTGGKLIPLSSDGTAPTGDVGNFTGPPRANSEFSGGTIGGPVLKNRAFIFNGLDPRLISGSQPYSFACTPIASGVTPPVQAPGNSSNNSSQTGVNQFECSDPSKPNAGKFIFSVNPAFSFSTPLSSGYSLTCLGETKNTTVDGKLHVQCSTGITAPLSSSAYDPTLYNIYLNLSTALSIQNFPPAVETGSGASNPASTIGLRPGQHFGDIFVPGPLDTRHFNFDGEGNDMYDGGGPPIFVSPQGRIVDSNFWRWPPRGGDASSSSAPSINVARNEMLDFTVPSASPSARLDTLNLESWSWGATNPTSLTGKGLSSGRVNAPVAVPSPSGQPTATIAVEIKDQNMAVDSTVITIQTTTPAQTPPGGKHSSRNPSHGDPDATRNLVSSHLQPVAFHPSNALDALPSGTVVRVVPRAHSMRLATRRAPQPATQAAAPVSFSLVANGNSSGDAFEVQVVDPTGKLKEIRAPDGLILEPLKRGSAKPVSAAPGEKVVKHPLRAYCVDYAKDPPEPEAIYRVAAPDIQERYKPIRMVMRAGRELAAAGKFHPDSDADAYNDSIRQYSLWTKLENWNEQKFGEVFLEKTKQNAVAAKVKWSKQMDQAVRALVPGRWSDVAMVLEEAKKLETSSQAPGAPSAPAR